MALSTDYVMRTGSFEPGEAEVLAYKEIQYKGKVLNLNR